MMTVLTDRTPAGEAVAEAPPALVYEMDAGRPIYYRGYRSVLGGHRQAEEIAGSSYLQSLVVSTILRYLMQHLPARYRVLANELGLLISEKSWRAVDIAIYHASQLQGIPLHNQYLAIPPQVVIKVDTKADLAEFTTAMDNRAGHSMVTTIEPSSLTQERDIQTIVHLLRAYDPERIILFGSRARGNADEYSDCDLVVIKRTDQAFLERLRNRVPFLVTFGRPRFWSIRPKSIRRWAKAAAAG